MALDGQGENSPYTSHLVQTIKTPGLTIEKVFKTVRIAVMEETGEQQMPWESSSLTGEFYFLPAPTPNPTPTPAPTPTQAPTPLPVELRLLQKAREYLQNQQYVLAFELLKELSQEHPDSAESRALMQAYWDDFWISQEHPDSAESRAGMYEMLHLCKLQGDAAYERNDPQAMEHYYSLYVRIAEYTMHAFDTDEFQQELSSVRERLNPAPAEEATTILTVEPEPEFHFDDFLVKNSQGQVVTAEDGRYTLELDESIELTARFTAIPPRKLGVSWTTGRGGITPQ